MPQEAQRLPSRPSIGEYFASAAIIAAGIVLNGLVTSGPIVPADARELVPPMLAMFASTAVVWLLMVLFRNGAVLFGAASVTFYRDYKSGAPDEWIERPARAFNNLMQVPTLFYVVNLLMTAVPWADRAQVTLAWIYVVARAVHAIIYIGFNYVPFRFAIYAVSCITLGVMWARLAMSF